MKKNLFCSLFSHYERRKEIKCFSSASGVWDGQKALSWTDVLISESILSSLTLTARQGHSIMRPTGFQRPWLCDGNCGLWEAFNTLRESQDEFKMRVLSDKNKIK